jgi:hypothetical protein
LKSEIAGGKRVFTDDDAARLYADRNISRVTHAMVVIGSAEREGVKFWLVQTGWQSAPYLWLSDRMLFAKGHGHAVGALGHPTRFAERARVVAVRPGALWATLEDGLDDPTLSQPIFREGMEDVHVDAPRDVELKLIPIGDIVYQGLPFNDGFSI